MNPANAAESLSQLKAELERTNRLYSALSQINQAILRSRNQPELFDKVCQVAVELGGFRLAFVGLVDGLTQRVIPVAKFGHTDYLEHAAIFADHRQLGSGPTGLAIHSGKPYICKDFFNDPATEPWRVAAAEKRFRSSGTFPICREGKVAGVFVLYAGEVGYFRDREVQLLEEVAGDLSYALEHFGLEDERRKAEEAAQRLAAIVESSRDAILSASLDGTILSWNAAAELLYGFTAEEAVGQNLSLVIPPGKQQEAEDLLDAVCTGRTVVGIETERLHKAGFRIPVALTLSPVRDAAGADVGVSKVARDLSERNATLDAQREVAGLFEILAREVPVGVAMFDREMRLLVASERWKQDRGLAGQEVIGRAYDDLVPGTPERWRQEHARALTGETIVVEEDSFTRSDGQVRWLRRILRPWVTGSGEIGGLLTLVKDITERKLAQAALKETEAELSEVVNNLEEGLFTVSPEGIFVTWNPAAERMYGMPETGGAPLTLARYAGSLKIFAEDGSVLPPDKLADRPHSPRRADSES